MTGELGALTTWTEVAVRALDVVQVVLLAAIARNVSQQGLAVDEIRQRSKRRRAADPSP